LEDNDDDDDTDSSHHGDESIETAISTDMDPATGTGVYENVSKQKMTSLKCYISVQQRKFMDNYLLENQLSATEMQRAPDINFKNLKWRAFHDKSFRLCGRQRLAFDIATSYINGSRTGQLQMFMSGEGGTGISVVIKFIMEYTRLFFFSVYTAQLSLLAPLELHQIISADLRGNLSVRCRVRQRNLMLLSTQRQQWEEILKVLGLLSLMK
jgi:hypothetical protein